MSNLRVGVVGNGYSTRTFHLPLINATGGMAVTALVSRNTADSGSLPPGVQIFSSLDDLIESGTVDLVVIASPNETHVVLAQKALEAGLPVVVDKPLTPTLAEARELASLSADRGVMLSLFQNRRWDSDYLGVRETIDSGRLGRIVHFESRMERHRPAVRDRWREQDRPASGLWFDLGPHLADQALQLFGLPERVQANFARVRDNAVVDDWAHVILEYSHLRAVLHCSLVGSGGPRFIVHGTSGSATKQEPDRQEAQLLSGLTPGGRGWGHDPDPLVVVEHDSGSFERAYQGDQRLYYARVAASLLGGAPNPVPPAQALAISAVLEAAAISARQGQAIEIALSEQERAAWERSIHDARD